MAKGTCEWDDFECLIARYKSEQISNLFGQLLLLRELGTTADALTGGKTYGYTGPAGVRFFADALKTSVQASQGELDEAFLKSANNTAGALFHYPAGAINNFLDGAVAIENGEVEGVSMFGALIAGAP